MGKFQQEYFTFQPGWAGVLEVIADAPALPDSVAFSGGECLKIMKIIYRHKRERRNDRALGAPMTLHNTTYRLAGRACDVRSPSNRVAGKSYYVKSGGIRQAA
jgi:hypothetical protein